MQCEFCTEFAAASPDSRIITETNGWVLLPTIGCFTPGYCLFMPVCHLDAAADAPPAELATVQGSLEDMRAAITTAFGPTVIAEHGPRGCQLGASCCSHAHFHLIPVPDPDAVTAAYTATGGPGTGISGIGGLTEGADGAPYLYLSPRPGTHLIWLADGFARQYVRRVCASQHGVGDQFDWRDHAFDGNQALTNNVLRPSLTRRAA